MIRKRNGDIVSWDTEKIRKAVAAAFESIALTSCDLRIQAVTEAVEKQVHKDAPAGLVPSVEEVQDRVEQELMVAGCYEVAKSFILYRNRRAQQRSVRNRLLDVCATAGLIDPTFETLCKEIEYDFPGDAYSLEHLLAKYQSFAIKDLAEQAAVALVIRSAVELTSQQAPRWEFIASRFLAWNFHRGLDLDTLCLGINGFAAKVRYLATVGLYGQYIADGYSDAELTEAVGFIHPDRDKLLTYSALDLLLRRYVIQDRSRRPLESPQELFLGIALHLALKEGHNRLDWVRRFYDMLSSLKVTLATPTLSNARKPYHQLSSCFIDTVPDSLDGIYRSIDSFAKVSKFGGGMGLYFGKVRAVGGPIRGFAGAAGGVLRWIKLANDTAVAVDQLGVRAGSVAVYLDAWHKDIPEFLQLRTNNGDDRMKAHDLFPALCYPDLFWRRVRDTIDSDWQLMCPHEVLTVMGWALEDFWGEEWERRYEACCDEPKISKRSIPLKELVRLIIKSAVETGTPFAFNRDTVNRLNPNSHRGIIYCSNLCTEIAQNMSAVELVSNTIIGEGGDTIIVETTRPGDFVVCNLASLVLGSIDFDAPGELESIVVCAVRALDNVIDLNFYPVPYAEVTNRRWRAIGLGVSGYHHLLAIRGIKWESETHLDFADALFARINQAAIGASSSLAAEKGSYPNFAGSDWETGAYFVKRGYAGPDWDALRRSAAAGMRNAWLLAIAPTSSTSIIAGTTAGVDPVMNKFFLEEKKGSIVPRVAPDLSLDTLWYYKNAHQIDQSWVVRAAGVRQKHIDQSQSVNLYVTTNFTLRGVLDLYIQAWEAGVKTVYYVRSQALEVAECESCSG